MGVTAPTCGVAGLQGHQRRWLQGGFHGQCLAVWLSGCLAVWLSGDGISIVNPQGKRIGVIRISGPAANCELGADGYLYIAANKHLMRVKVKAQKIRA